jgi:hypothetical protein
MSKFAKGKSWIEHRLDSDLDVDGRHYTVNLLARKGTGVQGFRVTVVYLPHEGGDATWSATCRTRRARRTCTA